MGVKGPSGRRSVQCEDPVVGRGSVWKGAEAAVAGLSPAQWKDAAFLALCALASHGPPPEGSLRLLTGESGWGPGQQGAVEDMWPQRHVRTLQAALWAGFRHSASLGLGFLNFARTTGSLWGEDPSSQGASRVGD